MRTVVTIQGSPYRYASRPAEERPVTAPSPPTLAEPRPGGRPRDPRVDDAIRRAAHDLLLEEGYPATTIQAIARRAGVSPQSIYRRWPNRVALLHDVVYPPGPMDLPPTTDDVEADLRAWMRSSMGGMTEPAAQVAIPGLLADYRVDPSAYDRLVERAEVPYRAAFAAMLASHVAAGRASADVTPDTVFDLVLGTSLVAALIPGHRDLDALVVSTAAALARSVRVG
jgi:AcrR family transcriptional regulator